MPLTPVQKQSYLAKGFREAYGVLFPPRTVGKTVMPYSLWEIERDFILGRNGLHDKPGFLGKVEHFKRLASILMGHKGMAKPFQWNPNALKILDAYFAHDFLAIAGHASSSKTETVAVIALTEFCIDPLNTGCLVASTTIPEARGRIWGRIEYYWNYGVVEFYELLSKQTGVTVHPPGELISSSALIRYKDFIKDIKDDTRGIKLLPGKESEIKEGIGRMKGFKAPRLRFYADEMSDLSHKLLDAAETNLFVGGNDFKMVGMFNPASHFDPAGVLAEPVDGWDSINVLEMDEWKTTRGWCLRFDGERSPNVVARQNIWDGLLTHEKLENRREVLGNNSTRFMEQYRGAWSATGHSDGIYSEAEIIKYRAQKKVDVWLARKTLCAGFDPAFSHGGDRAAVVFCNVGTASINSIGKPVIEVQDVVYLDEEIDTSQDKKELILSRLRKECQKRGLDPRNLGIDSTGGGDVLATLMSRDPYFGSSFLKVQFGSGGSDMEAFDDHERTGKDRYYNMCSEIWYSGKPLLLEEQLRGLTPSIVREMTQRLYEESGKPPKIKVEPKEKLKARLNGKSCDTADAYFVALHVARQRLGLKSTAKTGKSTPASKPYDPYGHLRPTFGEKKRKSMEPVLPDKMAGVGSWGYDAGQKWTPFN